MLHLSKGNAEERFANFVEEHPLLRVLENGREFRRGSRTDVCLVEPLGRNAVIRPGLRNIRIINRVIGVTHRRRQCVGFLHFNIRRRDDDQLGYNVSRLKFLSAHIHVLRLHPCDLTEDVGKQSTDALEEPVNQRG